jgi:alkylation response protein AidB-like acyl-CoA dehydrogenase
VKISIALDEMDAALAEAAERYTRERCDFAARQRLPAAQRRFDADAWREMAQLGWLSVAASESHGGLGMRAGSIALLARAAGAAGVNEPLISTLVAAHVIGVHASNKQRDAWLPRVLEGRLRAACAFGCQDLRDDADRLTGRCEVVLDGDIADLLLVEWQGRWFALDANANGVRREPYPLMDGRGAATLTFEACEAEALAAPASPASRRIAALAIAADAVGAMGTALALTLDYIKMRKQFGVALGSHQTVAHRAVDMFMRLQECEAVLARAVQAADRNDDAHAFEIHAAKAFIGPQSRLLAQEAVQLHGGIGITEEYGVSHCLRRVLVDEQLYGHSREHLREFAAAPKAR